MKDKRGVGSLNLVLGPEINGDAVFPVFQLLVEFTDCVQQFPIRLLRCFGGVETLIYSAFDGGEFAQRSEQVEFAFPIGKWNISNVVWRIITRELDVHVIIILHGWPAGSKTEAVQG